MKFCCRNTLKKISRHTNVRGDLGDTQGSVSYRTVVEQEETTSPRMRVRNLNVVGIAWSNFEPGVDINESLAIMNIIVTIDVVNVDGGIHIAVVTLKDGGDVRLRARQL